MKWQCLGKNISALIMAGNREEPHQASIHLLTHNVAIDVEMFCALMEDEIGIYMECTLTIVIKDSRSRAYNMKILQKVMDPLKFTRSSHKSTILSFGRRS